MPIITCKQCSKEVNKRKGQEFCSKSCSLTFRQTANDPDFLSDPNVSNEFKGYFVGLIFADGCLVQQKNQKEIILCLKDGEMIERIHKIICPNRKIHVNKRRSENHSQVYTIKTSNQKVIEQMEMWGLKRNKSRTLTYPTNLPLDTRHFIKGFFDGDGSIFKSKVQRGTYKHISFTTGSGVFALELQTILKNLSFDFSIVTDGRNDNKYLKMYKQNEVTRFREWMYQDSNWHLERKYNLFYEDIV